MIYPRQLICMSLLFVVCCFASEADLLADETAAVEARVQAYVSAFNRSAGQARQVIHSIIYPRD